MNSRRIFLVLIFAAIAIFGLTGFAVYKGSAVLHAQGDELAKLKLDSETLDNRQDALARAERDINQYAELEKIAKTIVPQEKDQARTIREITTIASDNKIPLALIQFPASALGEVQKNALAKTKPAKPVNPATSQLVPVKDMDGLYAMEITISSDKKQPISYPQLLRFLEGLENNRRTAHVTQLTIQPDKETRSLISFTVILNVYIKP